MMGQCHRRGTQEEVLWSTPVQPRGRSSRALCSSPHSLTARLYTSLFWGSGTCFSDALGRIS